MDNFLIQVKGEKQVVLYSPRDVPYLYLSGMHVPYLELNVSVYISSVQMFAIKNLDFFRQFPKDWNCIRRV